MTKSTFFTPPPMVDFGPVIAFWSQQAELAMHANLQIMKAAMAPWQVMGVTFASHASAAPAKATPAKTAPQKPAAAKAAPTKPAQTKPVAAKTAPAEPAAKPAPAAATTTQPVVAKADAAVAAPVAPAPKAQAAATTAKAAAPAPEAKPNGPTKPAGLPAPRGGKADSLVAIKGLGPKLEAALNEIGIYHYDQIAQWSAEEIAWADAHVGTIRGRASRDDWKGQAAALARSDGA